MSTTVTSDVSAAQYDALQPYDDPPTPEQLFFHQIRRFKNKGLDLPHTEVERLQLLIPSKPQQLFLVIPPRPDTLDLGSLMSLIEVDGIKGGNCLDLENLTDMCTDPQKAHLLLNVEDGRRRLNALPCTSFQNIQRENRVAFSVWYGLILGIVFPYVLKNHHLDLCGSRYRSSSNVPILYLCEGAPKLYSSFLDQGHPKRGAPSADKIRGIL